MYQSDVYDFPFNPFRRFSRCLSSLAVSRRRFFQARLLSPRFSQNHFAKSDSSLSAPLFLRTGVSMDDSSSTSISSLSSSHFMLRPTRPVSGVGAALLSPRAWISSLAKGVCGATGSVRSSSDSISSLFSKKLNALVSSVGLVSEEAGAECL